MPVSGDGWMGWPRIGVGESLIFRSIMPHSLTIVFVYTLCPGLRMSDPIATESITPRDLVTHRSGLPRHDMVWYNTRLTGKDVFARLAHFEPTEPLRSKFQYNNMMFMVAGYLVETVDGRPWEEAVRARIFRPLGMDSSNFSVLDSQKADDFARPYDEQEGKVRVIPFRDITNVGPAGSINSNVADMARWVAVHTHGGKLGGKTIISPAVLDDLHTPQIPTGSGYGRPRRTGRRSRPARTRMGWMIDTYRGHRRVHHGGAIDGFTAKTCLFPDDGMGIVVLTNKDGTPLPETDHPARGRPAAGARADRLAGRGPRPAEQGPRRRQGGQEEEGVGPAPRHASPPTRWRNTPATTSIPATARSRSSSATASSSPSTTASGPRSSTGTTRSSTPPRPTTTPRWPTSTGRSSSRPTSRATFNAVAVPLEPSVKPIVFTRRPDRKLSDPEYLKRFEGEYELAGQTATIRLQGHVLIFEQAGGSPVELVPDRER